MQSLKLVEIKDFSVPEIQEQLKKSRLDFVTLRMKFASRQLEDSSFMKKKRKEIARLLTVLTQKGGKELLIQESKPLKKEVEEEQKPKAKNKVKAEKREIKKEVKEVKEIKEDKKAKEKKEGKSKRKDQK